MKWWSKHDLMHKGNKQPSMVPTIPYSHNEGNIHWLSAGRDRCLGMPKAMQAVEAEWEVLLIVEEWIAMRNGDEKARRWRQPSRRRNVFSIPKWWSTLICHVHMHRWLLRPKRTTFQTRIWSHHYPLLFVSAAICGATPCCGRDPCKKWSAPLQGSTADFIRMTYIPPAKQPMMIPLWPNKVLHLCLLCSPPPTGIVFIGGFTQYNLPLHSLVLA